MSFYYLDNNYEVRVKEENEDYNTKELRDIRLSLTDKQVNNLEVLAYEAGHNNVEELLESLVGDLTQWQSNGSDERELAINWYGRAFGASINTTYHFREFLNGRLIYAEDLVSSEEELNKAYNQYLQISEDKDHYTKEECLEIAKEIKNKMDLHEKLIEKYFYEFRTRIENRSTQLKEQNKYTEDEKSFMLDVHFGQVVNLILKDKDLDSDNKSEAISNIHRAYNDFLKNDRFTMDI
jgi:hypothetical protein